MSQRKFARANQKKKKESTKTENPPTQQPSVQAMVWYKEDDWDTLKEMFDDADMLPKTYDDWLVRAEEMKEKVQEQGDMVIKVFIDPQTFPEWCQSKGLPMNAEARSQLAIEVAQAQSFSL